MVACLDASLRKLDTDYVDIFHLHGLSPTAYDRAMSEIVPALLREKEKGKFRHLAVSETGPRDPEHKMLERAVEEPLFEVVMLAFHMMNQNARKPVLERARANKIGTLCMFAVRNVFSKPGLLEKTIADLAAEGKLPRTLAENEGPARLPGARRAAPRASSMPPIASRATSPASTSCCSAPAASSTCAPTSPRSCARRCRPSTCRSSMPCSATSSASASTCRTGSRRRPASRKCRQLAKPAGRRRIPAGCVLGWLRHNVRALMTQTSASPSQVLHALWLAAGGDPAALDRVQADRR